MTPVNTLTPWKCPKCKRSFTRKNQRHACGTGDRSEVLRNRPDALVALYDSVESFAKSLGSIEIVARERYVLLRTVRIFADMVIMTDAVRIAIHLERRVTRRCIHQNASVAESMTTRYEIISARSA